MQKKTIEKLRNDFLVAAKNGKLFLAQLKNDYTSFLILNIENDEAIAVFTECETFEKFYKSVDILDNNTNKDYEMISVSIGELINIAEDNPEKKIVFNDKNLKKIVFTLDELISLEEVVVKELRDDFISAVKENNLHIAQLKNNDASFLTLSLPEGNVVAVFTKRKSFEKIYEAVNVLDDNAAEDYEMANASIGELIELIKRNEKDGIIFCDETLNNITFTVDDLIFINTEVLKELSNYNDQELCDKFYDAAENDMLFILQLKNNKNSFMSHEICGKDYIFTFANYADFEELYYSTELLVKNEINKYRLVNFSVKEILELTVKNKKDGICFNGSSRAYLTMDMENLVSMSEGCIKKTKDYKWNKTVSKNISKFVDDFITETNPNNYIRNKPFEDAERALLTALFTYTDKAFRKKEHALYSIETFLNLAKEDKDNKSFNELLKENPDTPILLLGAAEENMLDDMFTEIAANDPNSDAYKYYKTFCEIAECQNIYKSCIDGCCLRIEEYKQKKFI